MKDGLLIGAVAVAALACPLHMWWMHRRGTRAPQRDDAPLDVAALRSRRDEIEAQLAEFEVAGDAQPTTARR